MNKFRKREVEQVEKPVRQEGCSASGCPLRGTVCTCTNPDEYTHWYCRFHAKAPPNDFYAVTEVLKKYMSILRFAHSIKVAPNMIVGALYRTFKDSQFEKREDENQQSYVVRLEAIVASEVRKVLSF